MDLLAAIKREERKLEKELTKLQAKLSVSVPRHASQKPNQIMSAAARAKILKATKLLRPER